MGLLGCPNKGTIDEAAFSVSAVTEKGELAMERTGTQLGIATTNGGDP